MEENLLFNSHIILPPFLMPQRATPAGYYDLYVADFTCYGLEYGISTEQLSTEELVKIVTSFISNADSIPTEN